VKTFVAGLMLLNSGITIFGTRGRSNEVPFPDPSNQSSQRGSTTTVWFWVICTTIFVPSFQPAQCYHCYDLPL